MDRIAKFLILLVAAIVLVPGCFAEENATATENTAATHVASDVVNNTEAGFAANLSEINATVEGNSTAINATSNLTDVNKTSVKNETSI